MQYPLRLLRESNRRAPNGWSSPCHCQRCRRRTVRALRFRSPASRRHFQYARGEVPAGRRGTFRRRSPMTNSSAISAKCEISFTVNGERQTVSAYPMERLLDVLRQHLGLTGAKGGCGEGACGSRSILIDCVLLNSCLVPLLGAKDAQSLTIEALVGDHVHKMLQALL